MGSLEIGLFSEGMSLLHRAGLAGLWLTLDALDQELARDPKAEARRLRELGSWERTNHSVTLSWEGKDADFTDGLLRYAYPVSGEGLLHFAAFGDPLQFAAEAFAIHGAMLATFLQHPQSRKAESGRATGRVALQIEDDVETFPIRRVRSHNFATAPFSPSKIGPVTGWLVPGGAVRHVGLGRSTGLTEAPGPLLSLRFAPVGCLFFLIRRHGAGGNTRYQTSIVIPEVDDLQAYADLRWAAQQTVDLRDVYAAGPADAALRLLVLDAGRAAAKAVTSEAGRRCRVMTFGPVPWLKQRIRVDVLDVGRVVRPDVRTFDAIRGHLPARRVRSKGQVVGADEESAASSWIDVPLIPEHAAENLIRGRPWWQGFAELVADEEVRDHVFRWERKGLQQMVNDPQVMREGSEQAIVRACHEAWRRRLGQLGERARHQGLDFTQLAGQEFERTRIAFSRCKTPTDFRRTITDFWARGGPQPELREHWTTILPFLTDDKKWMLGRDLALLALASYAGQAADESDLLLANGGKENEAGTD